MCTTFASRALNGLVLGLVFCKYTNNQMFTDLANTLPQELLSFRFQLLFFFDPSPDVNKFLATVSYISAIARRLIVLGPLFTQHRIRRLMTGGPRIPGGPDWTSAQGRYELSLSTPEEVWGARWARLSALRKQ